jgi:O-antigen/teichoic acid export membrane protein
MHEDSLAGLGQRAVTSAVILSIKRIISQLLITGSNIILARILFPEYFGVFAIISFLVFIFSHLGDLGLGTALVQQKKEPSITQLRGVFTVHLLISVVSFLALWWLAPILIRQYGEQLPIGSTSLFRLLGFSLPLGVLGNISGRLMVRQLMYKKFAFGEVVQLAVSKIVAVILAISGFGVASLVWAEIAMRVTGSVLYLFLYPWRIGISFNFSKLYRLGSFGLPFQASAWIGLLNGAVVPVFIGNYPGPGGWSGAQAVGFLSFAAGLAAFSQFFSETIGQLIFPVISRVQSDLERVRKSIERSLEISVITSLMIIIVFFVFSREIISLVYTDKWLPSVTVLRLLLLQSIEVSIGIVLMNSLLALGEAKVFLKMSIFFAVLQWLLTIPLVLAKGFVGLGWASLLVSFTGVVLPWYLLRKRVVIYVSDKILPIIGISLVSLFASLILREVFTVDSIWTLLIVSLLSFGIYVLSAFLFLRKRFITDISYLFRMLRISGLNRKKVT